MDSRVIQALKVEGVRLHLESTCREKLWAIRRCTEAAAVDNFKDVRRQLKEARRLLDDIEHLQNEIASL